ncbi:hypothetical protein SAMN05421768_10492 [Chryseobacterium joostei]|uniref:Predicted pPIWI-associating nuclease domain-containing protein n=2 Tax=Chryseobacterium joostei TaxID=112234 RepID=A0A1N7ICE9_9FLAO|nr:hypothetical protein [Chryseobacterium joostei]SIS34735.1 hypothetical protein SAMN05421768_10492 [Chryseobacterium joostei]
MENNFEKMQKIIEESTKWNQLSKLAYSLNPLHESTNKIIEMQNRLTPVIPTFDFPKFPSFNLPKIDIPSFDGLFNNELLEKLKQIGNIGEKLKNNPELQFAFISNLEILNLTSAVELKESLISDLTDKDIKEKEEILNNNLIPYLENHNLQNLWVGATQVLESANNPDKLRQCLISLRTILEYLIDEKLAPIEELKNSDMFKNNFKKFHAGKKKIEFIKIKREEKIKYFISKFEFGTLEEFTKSEIQYVCDCYSILCNVHQPNVGLSENQVRSLKVKTGITIWLLVYLYNFLEE